LIENGLPRELNWCTEENGYQSINRIKIRSIDSEVTGLLIDDVEVGNYWTSLD
jgi:hypothetical protein